MSGRQDTGARGTDHAGTTASTTTQAPTPLIPTQGGHVLSAPVPVVVAPEVPTQRTAGEPPQGAPRPVRPRARQVVALLAAGAVLVTAGGVWAVQQERAERAEAQRAAQARVDGVVAALAPELAVGTTDGVLAGNAVVTTLRTDAGAAGRAAVDRANGTLAASAQAGDGPRGALQAAVAASTGALDAPAVSLTTLRTTTAGLAAPEKAVVEAQAAWQAAEDARIAAEAAAAAQAQAAAAAQAAARNASRGSGSSKGTTTRRSTGGGTSTGTSSGGSAPAPAAPAPAAGLPTAGSEASSGDVGAALNAHRAANGLGALSIVRSGARVEHAMQMAASDSIWHSGTRAGSPKARPEIVGRVSPGSATRMIAAYAGSSGHNAQMLGSYSTAYIGAVSYDGWLYTSITFG